MGLPRVRGHPDRLCLETCERLLARHLAGAVARFGARALGVLDLPSLVEPGEIDADHLRAAAVLYWASEVEQAGLPGLVEKLAEGVVHGRLPLAISGAAADRLGEYWRERTQRFGPEERQALYQRLFGDESGFPREIEELSELLAGLGDAGPLESTELAEARARVMGRQLADSLSQRAAGISAFAARDISMHVRQAAAILKAPEVAAALGGAGGGLWRTVRLAAPLVLHRRLDPDPHLQRARAGMELLSWLADHAGRLATGRLAIPRHGPAVEAAQMWRAAGGRA